MASPTPIDLKDGRERALKFGTLALGECERDVFKGRATAPVVIEFYDVEPPRYMIAGLLWAGLRWQEPRLTYVQACAMVDEYLDGSAPGDLRTGGILFLPILQALIEAGIIKRVNGTGGTSKREEADPNAQTRGGHSDRSSTGSTTSSQSSAAGTAEAPTKSGKKLSAIS